MAATLNAEQLLGKLKKPRPFLPQSHHCSQRSPHHRRSDDPPLTGASIHHFAQFHSRQQFCSTLQSLPGTTPNENITVVSQIWEQPSPTMASPSFHFQWSAPAAKHNWDMLEQHQFSLSSTLRDQHGMPLGLGQNSDIPSSLIPFWITIYYGFELAKC